MLQNLVQKYASRRIASSLLVATTLSLSSPVYAEQQHPDSPIILAQRGPRPSYLPPDPNQPKPSEPSPLSPPAPNTLPSSLELKCSDYADGRAQIGKTEYCVNKNSVVYHRSGAEINNPELLQVLQGTNDYQQALQQVQSSSSLTPAEQKRAPPPPYLLPGGGSSPSPGYSPPPSSPTTAPIYSPPSPQSEQGTKNKGNDVLGYILTGIGLVDIGISVVVLADKPSCEREGTCYNPHEEEDKPVLIGWIVAGVVLSSIGIYLLND